MSVVSVKLFERLAGWESEPGFHSLLPNVSVSLSLTCDAWMKRHRDAEGAYVEDGKQRGHYE